jgi:hypothetical protein
MMFLLMSAPLQWMKLQWANRQTTTQLRAAATSGSQANFKPISSSSFKPKGSAQTGAEPDKRGKQANFAK